MYIYMCWHYEIQCLSPQLIPNTELTLSLPSYEITWPDTCNS